MEKEIILIVFPTLSRSNYFIEDSIKKIIPTLEKTKENVYESKDVIFKAYSLYNPTNLRGLRADYVFLSDDFDYDTYNILLHIVKGDHRKIKVVI